MRRLILLFCLTIAGVVHAQDVVRVNRPYALLDLPESSGITPGTVLPVERHLPSGTRVTVGRLKILFFRDTLSAAEIVNEDRFLSIQAGDRLQLNALRIPEHVQRGSFGEAVRSPWISYTAAGLGLVSGGLAWFYYDKAGKTADTTPDNLSHYLRLSEKVTTYDNRSNLFQGVGAGFLVFSALHYFFIREAPPAVQKRTALTSWQRDGAVFAGLTFTIPPG